MYLAKSLYLLDKADYVILYYARQISLERAISRARN